MRPPGTALQLERRRRQAIRLLTAGTALSAIARAVGASVSSVFRWAEAYRKQGLHGLQPRPTPGRPPKSLLGAEEAADGPAPEGALGTGLSNRSLDLETRRAAESPAVRGALPPLSYLEAPDSVGLELSEARTPCPATGRGRDCTVETVPLAPYKKTLDDVRPTSSFLMNRAFGSSPTWPVPGRPKDTRRSCAICTSRIGSPRSVRWPCRPSAGRWRRHNLTGLAVRTFLCHLLRHLRGPVVLLWDRGTIHRRQAVNHWITVHPRLQVEEFPAYAPELNPAEYIWAQADRALANSAPTDVAQLDGLLRSSVRRIRRAPPLLWSCIHASDLP